MFVKNVKQELSQITLIQFAWMKLQHLSVTLIKFLHHMMYALNALMEWSQILHIQYASNLISYQILGNPESVNIRLSKHELIKVVKNRINYLIH